MQNLENRNFFTSLAVVVAFVGVFGFVFYFGHNFVGRNQTANTLDSQTPTVIGAPIAETLDAADVTASTAVLSGRLDTRGVQTKFWFVYGPDATLKMNTTATHEKILASDSGAVSAKEMVSKLASDTQYYYQLIAESPYGTTRGAVFGFRTNK